MNIFVNKNCFVLGIEEIKIMVVQVQVTTR